jgi:hypothetical protein
MLRVRWPYFQCPRMAGFQVSTEGLIKQTCRKFIYTVLSSLATIPLAWYVPTYALFEKTTTG